MKGTPIMLEKELINMSYRRWGIIHRRKKKEMNVCVLIANGITVKLNVLKRNEEKHPNI